MDQKYGVIVSVFSAMVTSMVTVHRCQQMVLSVLLLCTVAVVGAVANADKWSTNDVRHPISIIFTRAHMDRMHESQGLMHPRATFVLAGKKMGRGIGRTLGKVQRRFHGTGGNLDFAFWFMTSPRGTCR